MEEKANNLEILATRDGSQTLLNKELNATYHSRFGAVQESCYVFIEKGLRYTSEKLGNNLTILEIGLGTGLNAFLTLIESQKKTLKINYFGIEKFPVPQEIYQELTYAKEYEPAAEALFLKIHSSEWDHAVSVTNDFVLMKQKGDANQIVLPGGVHLIYFDAFAPSTAPEMWTPEMFEKLRRSLIPGGVLVTFCAKGEVKRTLKQSGFEVETLVGPPGKREMVRAVRVD